MAEFQVSFIIDGKRLGDLLASLHTFKISNLDMKPVVQKGARGKAGGKPGWQVIGDILANTKPGVPMRPRDMVPYLVQAGFTASGIASHITGAIQHKLIKKTAKGYVKA